MKDGTVKIEKLSIYKVKAAIIGTKITIGKFYADAADKELNRINKKTSTIGSAKKVGK